MSEEPQLPPIPSIGEVLYRKDRFIQKIYSVIKCEGCQHKFTRNFKTGDFTFKKIFDEECPNCKKTNQLTITEIYSEWIDPKKKNKNNIKYLNI